MRGAIEGSGGMAMKRKGRVKMVFCGIIGLTKRDTCIGQTG